MFPLGTPEKQVLISFPDYGGFPASLPLILVAVAFTDWGLTSMSFLLTFIAGLVHSSDGLRVYSIFSPI